MLWQRILILILFAGAAAPSFAQAPPHQAVAAGYATPVLMDNFATADITRSGSGSYNWFVPYSSTNYVVNANGLEILSDGSGFGSSLSSVAFTQSNTPPVFSTPGNINRNIGNGVAYRFGYFEAEVTFSPSGYDPTYAKQEGQSNGGDWPCFWLANLTAKYGGPIDANGDTAEIDAMEGFPSDAFSSRQVDDSPVTSATATVHEWGPRATNIAVDEFAVSKPNLEITNVYGLLWTPTKVSAYVNNVLVSSVAIGPGTPYPASAISYEMLQLGTGFNWPATFRYVRVWQ